MNAATTEALKPWGALAFDTLTAQANATKAVLALMSKGSAGAEDYAAIGKSAVAHGLGTAAKATRLADSQISAWKDAQPQAVAPIPGMQEGFKAVSALAIKSAETLEGLAKSSWLKA